MKTQEEVEKAILLFFRKDARSTSMYTKLAAEGFGDKKTLQRAFLALCALGYIVHTNARGPRAATFCISRRGREHVREHYGIDLPHPDAVAEVIP